MEGIACPLGRLCYKTFQSSDVVREKGFIKHLIVIHGIFYRGLTILSLLDIRIG